MDDDFDCDDFEKTLKVIVVGNGNVGKTSMTTRYAKGRFTGNYKKTIGVDFMEKVVELRDLGETVNLMIWDTAGQEEFDALTSRYYKGAGAVIYVFSTVDRDSFDDLPKWQQKVEDECGRICQVLVQNKIDLIEDAAMSRGEVEDMADYMRIRLFRSCVQDNVNVKEVFEYLCRQYLRYGASGGSDEAQNAVADIGTLSEATSRHQSRHQPYGSEKRITREISDLSDRESTASECRSAAPSPTPLASKKSTRAFPSKNETFSPSAPASIANARKERDEEEEDNGDEHSDEESDDEESSRRSRRENRENSHTKHKLKESSHRASDSEESQLQHESLSDGDEEGYAEPDRGDNNYSLTDKSLMPASNKLVPSKRRTNGKKHNPAAECTIS